MGIFKYFGDAFSGKIYKENTLIGSNVAKLLEKSQKLSDSKFIKHWTLSCLVCIHHVLDILLIEDTGDEVNTFKKHLKKLDKDKVFEIIKLLSGHYFSAFHLNKNNIEFLKKFKINEEEFKDDFFSMFEFTRDDEKVFKKLEKEHISGNNAYILHLYQKIFEKAYGMPDEKNIFAAMILGKALTIAYANIFFDVLDKSINKMPY